MSIRVRLLTAGLAFAVSCVSYIQAGENRGQQKRFPGFVSVNVHKDYLNQRYVDGFISSKGYINLSSQSKRAVQSTQGFRLRRELGFVMNAVERLMDEKNQDYSLDLYRAFMYANPVYLAYRQVLFPYDANKSNTADRQTFYIPFGLSQSGLFGRLMKMENRILNRQIMRPYVARNIVGLEDEDLANFGSTSLNLSAYEKNKLKEVARKLYVSKDNPYMRGNLTIFANIVKSRFNSNKPLELSLVFADYIKKVADQSDDVGVKTFFENLESRYKTKIQYLINHPQYYHYDYDKGHYVDGGN